MSKGIVARGCLPFCFMLDVLFAARQRSLSYTPLSPTGLTRCTSKRGAVLDGLYRTQRGAILAYLTSIVGREHAGDLAQEVFLRAASSPHLTRLDNPPAFLRRIARNLAIDFLRQARRQAVMVPLIEDQHGVQQALQQQELEAGEAESILADAIAALPGKTAKVFTMSRFEQKSYREIHRELGIALPTVDYHMMKALRHLREALG